MESDDEVSYSTSNDTINDLLEEQDAIIDNLREEIEHLKRRIQHLSIVINSKLPEHLRDIMEYLQLISRNLYIKRC
jgi:light-regulated signal transduction histidine kinase (bacteriophytochrome)